MSSQRLSNKTSEPASPFTAPGSESGRLYVRLEAAPGVGALRETRTAIERLCSEPCRFLGPVDDRLSLELEICDPGCHGAELLARRIFRIAGVHRVRAERRVPGRGVVYAIHLATALE